ncbi:serine protease [Pseudomonas sp. MWU12-2037]|uniref:trypsin-like serine peptidase n=1 Tax=Pseudomonas sp. MWU12-2037 TaxID=2928690 RepID=UPI002010753A|nr:serine protease [Pseudomonas sp. MWU12-2037]
MRALFIIGLILYTSLLTASLYAATIETEVGAPPPPRQGLQNKNGQNQHFSGVGRLGSNCTAALIDTRHNHETTAQPAYLLTAGHCISSTHKKIITNQTIDDTIKFNYFGDARDQIKTYKLKKINWSSMRGTDLAVIELEASLQELIDAGIQPLSIGARPEPGSVIIAIGAPLLDYLYQSFCTLAPATDYHLDSYGEHWIWRNMLNGQCHGIQRGASGGPIVELETGKVVGVLNSVHGDSDVYGSAIQHLQGCFTSGQFDPSITRCSLFPVYDIDAIAPMRQQNFLSAKPELGLEAVIPSWDLKLSISTPFYRYKTVHSLAPTCESTHGYSEAISTENAHINDVIGTTSGRHWLCIIGVEAPEQLPFHGIMKNNQSMMVDLLDYGDEPPKIDIFAYSDAPLRPEVYKMSVSTTFAPPTYTQIYSKTGSPSEVDCDDPVGYEEVKRDGHARWKHLTTWSSTQGEAKLCVYGKNVRGESSRPAVRLLKVEDHWKS